MKHFLRGCRRRPHGALPLLLAALAFGGASCDVFEYTPPDGRAVEAEASPFTAVVDLTQPVDTLLAWGDVTVRYAVDLNGQRPAALRAYVGDVLVGTSLDPSVLTFDSHQAPDGPGTFRLEVWAHYGDGGTIRLHERSWPIQVDNDPAPPQGVDVLGAEPSEGRLRVRWERYPRANFEAYRVYEVYEYVGAGGQREPRRELRAVVEARDRPEWVDSLYAGGAVAYQVEVVASTGTAEGAPLAYDGPGTRLLPPVIEGDDAVRLAWTPTPFPANFTAYTVERSFSRTYDGDLDFKPLATFTRPEDTAFVDRTFGFGAEVVYRIRVEPYAVRPYYSPLEPAAIGTEVPTFETVEYTPAVDAFYLEGYNRMLRLNSATYAVEAQREGNSHFSLTPSGRMFGAGGGSEEGAVIVEFDPRTLAPLRTVTTQSIVGYRAYPLGLAAADSGRIAYFSYTYRSPTFYLDGLRLVDVDAGRLLGGTSYGHITRQIEFAQDGRHLLTYKQELYRVHANGLTFVRTFWPHRAAFGRDGERLVVATDGAVVVYRLPDLSVEREFSVPDPLTYPDVDPATGLLGGYAPAARAYRIYDPATGALVYDLPIVSGIGSGDVFSLAGGTLFSGLAYHGKGWAMRLP